MGLIPEKPGKYTGSYKWTECERIMLHITEIEWNGIEIVGSKLKNRIGK